MKKGFTLLEVLIVVVIAVSVAVFAVPAYKKTQDKNRYLAAQGASKAFLFTDTDCTWEYYEHRGMRRAAEQSFAENAASILPERMFVYEMDLKDIGR